MRLVCISDTHGTLPNVPYGDVLIHAGDASMLGREYEIRAFNDWLGTLRHPHKIFVAGNHDWIFEKDSEKAKALLTNAIYLQDSGVEIEGVKFWGSPWQPAYNDWAFNLKSPDERAAKWAMIPNDTRVLITHAPPATIGDGNGQMMPCGCDALNWRVFQVKPEVHVYGHIHEGYGMRCREGITFINASVLDGKYRLVNEPIVIDLELP